MTDSTATPMNPGTRVAYRRYGGVFGTFLRYGQPFWSDETLALVVWDVDADTGKGEWVPPHEVSILPTHTLGSSCRCAACGARTSPEPMGR